MNLEQAVVNVAILWMLTTPHEFSHAWVATRLGDDTPELDGRVTLQPLAHIDWIGTTLLPFLTSLLGGGFIGWGKPVRVNPNRLRFGVYGLLLVALAGPASNLVFALLLAGLSVAMQSVFAPLAQIAASAAHLSVYLAIFNLIPIPPLDGSKLLIAARVPAAIYNELARFGFVLILLAFSYTGLGYRIAVWTAGITDFLFALVRR